jgi:hypothetical protein
MTHLEMQMLVEPGDDGHFSVHIEPEGMQYDLPPQEKVLLTFVGPEAGTQYLNVSHHRHALVIWRPGDTEVWATLSDGTHEQIAGFEGIPGPWLDSASKLAGQQPPWSWPPGSPEAPAN